MSILIHSTEPSFGPRYFIGLDAGRQTGLAVWDAKGQRFAREDAPAVWDALVTTGFWQAYEIVLGFNADDAVIVIEDPSKNRTTFDHGVPRSERAARRREKISRNVGSNAREAALLATGLERQGYRVCRVRPRSRKLSADAFRRLTRYQGRTSQHARDAAMLVFGLKNVPPETLGQVTLALYEGPSPPE